MTLYTPNFKKVKSGESAYFDGSSSSTGEAQVREITGNFNARVFLERSNDGGDSYEEISQFTTSTLYVSWQTKDIQPLLKKGERRIRVENSGKNDGVLEVVGDEL